MTPELRFRVAMEEIAGQVPLDRLGLAVSGGGDSLALLHLATGWAEHTHTSLHVVTVDHGLRPEAAAEAQFVASQARAAKASHDALRWDGWDGRGNLQDAARRARKRLIGDWAKVRNLPVVLTGHTADDQAETVLLRLSRGSGVDGLAGMQKLGRDGALVWARPLLGHRRAELREWLKGRNVPWVDDPSNEDLRFDRIRARKMLDKLGDLGLSVDRLVATAERMRLAADALRDAAGELAARVVAQDRGDLLIDRAGFRHAPADLQARLLAAGLGWIAGQVYRPRYAALQALLRDAAEGRGGTLQGCLLKVEGRARLRLAREPRAVADLVSEPGTPWDRRWQVEGPWQPGDRLRATGDALFDLPGWRDSGLPPDSLRAAPSVWRDDKLIAAPLAGYGEDWQASLAKDCDDFTLWLKAH